MKLRLVFTATSLLFAFTLLGQTGSITGRVFNDINNEPVPFANVVLEGTSIGASTDLDGKYTISNIEPGLYNVVISFVGFQPKTIFEVQVNSGKPTIVPIPLVESNTELEAVEISASPFTKTEESPVSLRSIGANEIQRYPGGNRDISVAIQSLPGVASTPAFRNDIIIRGGAPNENRFYLDGVEVPNINHFATQGSSGGPVGLINVNFINNVDFYSGAFPSNRGNALSSIFEFEQRDGNTENLKGTFTIGSSDYGLTFEGPIGEKSTFIFSARRSYLQLLFQALQLPFLPIYNDFQTKNKIRFNQKNELTIVGLGAVDNFEINTAVNDNVDDPETFERNEYILGNIASQEQWNYTIGAVYKHFSKRSFQTIVASRNMLNNDAKRFVNNDESNPANLLLDYNSREIENKFRVEHNWRNKGWEINVGANYELAKYTNSTFSKINLPNGTIDTIDFSSELQFNKFGLFGQLSKNLLGERLILSLGFRTDWNDYSSDMSNPVDQFSPRFSAAFYLTEKISINGNIGRYYQLPAYTVLGYRNSAGVLENAQNGVTYIENDQAVVGFEYVPKRNLKFSVEGFYKWYRNYPFLLRDSISLANLGGDFGVIGNEPVVPISDGRSYGIEFLAQQKFYKGFYGILAYTLVKSEFQDKNGEYRPSAWDNGNIINLTAGKKFKKNWEVGVRFRLTGGAPFTPFDPVASSVKNVWDTRGVGVRDWNRLNEGRNGLIHQMDFRIDKRYYFKKWSIDIYLDVQNAYNFQAQLDPLLLLDRDANGDPQTFTDAQNVERYRLKSIDNLSGNLLPSIGLIVEF